MTRRGRYKVGIDASMIKEKSLTYLQKSENYLKHFFDETLYLYRILNLTIHYTCIVVNNQLYICIIAISLKREYFTNNN